MQRAFQILRWLRNSVHNEALDLTREKQRFYVLHGFLREAHAGWAAADLGIRIQPPGGATAAKWLPGTCRYSVTVRRTGAPRPADPLEGMLIFEVRQLVNKLFSACLSALDQIMLITPLTGAPGYHPA